VISTPIILQCRSVADLYWGQDGEGYPPRTFGFHQASQIRDSSSLPTDPSCVTLFAFLFFLASQSSEQRTCLFLLSLCDSVVRLSMCIKRTPFHISLILSLALSFAHTHTYTQARTLARMHAHARTLSLSLSLSLAPPWRARTNVTRIRNVQFRKRDAPLSECGTNSCDLFFFSFTFPVFFLFLATSHANCFYFFRDEIFFLTLHLDFPSCYSR